MLRIKDTTLRSINKLTDDIERRIRRVESDGSVSVNGYTVTYNEVDGELVLTKDDIIIRFTKDS